FAAASGSAVGEAGADELLAGAATSFSALPHPTSSTAARAVAPAPAAERRILMGIPLDHS
ncbi:hypothetical protein ACFWCO_31210, partial [Streptomyces diastaticus]|uniref:hypothetical protein n=1 Tax=Streptomyces diastaticus TaxID=1956 RepID=UPI0036899209